MRPNPSVIVLYHFFEPERVISARIFSGFARALVERGWGVEVWTSNRYFADRPETIEPAEEWWEGVRVRRFARPAFDQSRDVPRMMNFGWMMARWSQHLLSHQQPSLYVVGSDPQFSQALFPVIKAANSRNRVVYWCFDLFPEALVAHRPDGWRASMARRIEPGMELLYGYADTLVDIGPCMRRRLERYAPGARRATLTPWALVEPARVPTPDQDVRRELFGEVDLAVLYSGSLGRAHRFRPFLELARRCSGDGPRIGFCFAVGGARAEELRSALRPDDRNIRVVSMAPEDELQARLSSADLHLLSLRDGWEGTVVPSKFFGSLAIGRPVLFAGPATSGIASWIHELGVGAVLSPRTLDSAVEELRALAVDRRRLGRWQRAAFAAYRKHFSHAAVMDGWDGLLHAELARL